MIAEKVVAAVSAVLLIAVGTYAAVLRMDLVSVRADLKACDFEKSRLVSSLETQNFAVQSWQDAASTAQQDAAQALSKARMVSAQHKVATDALRARIAAPTETACAPALNEIRKSLR